MFFKWVRCALEQLISLKYVVQMGTLCCRALSLMDLGTPSRDSSFVDAYLSELPQDAYGFPTKGGKLIELSHMIIHLRSVCSNVGAASIEHMIDFLPVCLALDLQCVDIRQREKEEAREEERAEGEAERNSQREAGGGVQKRWNSYDVCKDGCNRELGPKLFGCLMQCATRVHD
jgi:hypothetical protein